jgi:hypothetical protein
VQNDSFISIVLKTDYQFFKIKEKIEEIQPFLDTQYSDYEIVIIVQGPLSYGVTDSQTNFMLQNTPSIRLIQLAGRVHSDVAWAAGLENAIGDFVILFDHLTDPIYIISDIVEKCRSGYDVVVGVSEQPLTIFYKLFRFLSNRLLSAIDYHLPQSATELRCLSRRAVNSVTTRGSFHHQFFLRIQKTGYPACAFPYKLQTLSPVRKSSFLSFRHLIRLLVFNSSRPLRWMSALGLLGSFSAFTFAVYSLCINLVNGHVVEGWTTTILFMSLLFMFQFFMLAFFGEYLGRLLEDRNEQADYTVVFEKTSAVMVNQDRINVLNESLSTHPNFVQTGRDT